MTTGSAPPRILVVDDEPAILRFLRAGLGSQGYIVVEVASGQAALDAVRQRRADLVVLDLGLPDIDGLEVIRRIRETGAMLPIIVLSSRENEAAKVAALDLGADDYVTKPFGIDELLARDPRGAAASPAAAGRKAGVPDRRSHGRSGAADRDGARPGGEILAAGV